MTNELIIGRCCLYGFLLFVHGSLPIVHPSTGSGRTDFVHGSWFIVFGFGYAALRAL
jgi:hypothetical protein